MEFLVINGSPKAELSVTQQYVRFLEQRFEQHTFVRIHLARRKALERDPAEVQALIEQMGAADGVLWAWPVYYLLVPSQLKRLIELLFQAGAEQQLQGGYSTCLSTSVHFFDHTAHEYMQAVSEDLGMRAVAGLSCGMHDLLKPGFGDSLAGWFSDYARICHSQAPVAKRWPAVRGSALRYRPGRIAPAGPPPGKRIVLVSDAGSDDHNLSNMERVLAASLGGEVERISLQDLGLKGGCLGCLRCGWDGQCVYRDGFQEAFRERILTADGLIFSGPVRDRYLSARFKRFFDRSFFLGHRPELAGKPLVWLVSGPLGQLSTLRQVLEGYAEVGRTPLIEVVTDEARKSTELTALLREVAQRLLTELDHPLRRPRKFPAVAGTKVLRDFVWLATAIFPEDDRYYRAHGIYDFPHKQLGRRLIDRLMYWAMHLPPIRRRVQRDMRKLMLRPFEKIVPRVPVGRKSGPDRICYDQADAARRRPSCEN